MNEKIGILVDFSRSWLDLYLLSSRSEIILSLWTHYSLFRRDNATRIVNEVANVRVRYKNCVSKDK